jgi:SAM-dependent methyltransferase
VTPKRLAPSIDDVDAVRDVGARAHYDDPLYYDKAYRRRRHDVEYYAKVAKRWGGPVLEYGVGSGRVALELARAGLSVTGVDLSQPMLDQFEARLRKEPEAVRERVRLLQGDMREVSLRKRFPLVVAPFNVVLHLYEREDVEAFFGRVKRHLAPGGRFVFDFSVPVPADLALDPNRSYRAPPFVHPSTGKRMRYSERFEYHPLRQLLVVWMEMMPEDGGDPWVIPLSHRQFFPQEMAALLHYNGFRDVVMTEDFSDEPASPLADVLVASCGVAAPKPRSRRKAPRRR